MVAAGSGVPRFVLMALDEWSQLTMSGRTREKNRFDGFVKLNKDKFHVVDGIGADEFVSTATQR